MTDRTSEGADNAPDKSAEEWAREVAKQVHRRVFAEFDAPLPQDWRAACERIFATALTDAEERGLERAEKRLRELYASEREKVNHAADNDDDESFQFHKRRGDGFFEGAAAIRSLRK